MALLFRGGNVAPAYSYMALHQADMHGTPSSKADMCKMWRSSMHM